MEEYHDVLIAGAGPAGLSAAIAAAGAGASVLVLEKMPQPGLRLLASGGGHCNISNSAGEEAFVRAFGRQGRFILPALRMTPPEKLRIFMGGIGVKISSPDGFHFFPESRSSRDVLDALLRQASSLGVELRTGVRIEDMIIENGGVAGVRSQSSAFKCRAFVLATGGKSYPGLGGGDDGYHIAESAGHGIVAPLPALTDILVSEKWPGLCAGITLEDAALSIKVKGPATISRGPLVFTHSGVSGPAALDISGEVSSALRKHAAVSMELDLTPEISKDGWIAKFGEWQEREGAKSAAALLSKRLPRNLVLRLAEHRGIAADVKTALFPRRSRDELAAALKGASLTAAATGGFESAMVTRGGISLKHVDPVKLESRLVKGLFFAGEVLDLDGPCGGYNLQWAFSSGMLAGAHAGGVKHKP